MAKPWAAINGVVWALAAAAAVTAPPVWLGTSMASAQVPDRPVNVHAALRTAIACYRRGDYEKAAELLSQAQVAQNELSPAEVNDLNNYLRLDATALKAREEGGGQIRAAEEALRQGHTQEAAGLLKGVDANQYLTAADKRRAGELDARLRGAGGSPYAPETAGQPNPVQDQGQAGVKPSGPKPDAKALLTSARTALQQGNLDLADSLAAQAEAEAAATRGSLPAWMHPWSDTPAKVRRDVQAARLKMAAADGVKTPPSQTATASTSKSVNPTGPAAGQNEAPASQATLQARQFLRDGRAALRDGKLALARVDADKARDLHPDLKWWEDTPEKLVADVHRVESARAGAAKPAAAVVKAPAPAEPAKKANPRALLKEGRQLFAQGRFDEADKMAHEANAGPRTRWGLFEDNPDKLHLDIQKARTRRDQEESVKVLAEARKLYAQGKLAEAKSKAYTAQKLHGSYSMWDLGDRPQKLISEIEVAENRNHKTHVPAIASEAVVKNEAPAKPAKPAKSAVPAPGGPAAQARECLAAARLQMNGGNLPGAAQNIDRVRQLTAGWDTRSQGAPPWHEDLVVMERDFAAVASSANSSGNMNPPVQQVAAVGNPAVEDAARDQAHALLAEARALQKAGHLVEARQKALQAQRTSAAFGPNEDRPEIALLELAGLCDKKIVSLLALATDCVTAAGNDPTQFANAEAHLRQAQQLSDGFGFDSLRVANKMQWLRLTREVFQGKPAQPDTMVRMADHQTPQGPVPATDRDKGLHLLDSARLELSHGQTTVARSLAVQAYTTPEYGVQGEAEKVLRSIDTEEWNQKMLACNRAFDAGALAFNRHDYSYAARIFREIDLKMLSQDRSSRLKEIMMTAEMQPVALALDGPRTGVARASDTGQGPPPLPFNEGKANATDLGPNGPGEPNTALTKVVGMQEIKFQELHEQARRIQSDAMDRFKAGDTDRALDMLSDFCEKLNEAGLDQSRTAMLQKPIQARLQNLKTLKAQRDFERHQLASGTNRNNELKQETMKERQKQQQVAELMKQYHGLYHDAKFHEANMVAQKALELDPDNVAADAAVHISQMAQRHQDYEKLSKKKEQLDLNALNDTDDFGDAATLQDPVLFPKEGYDRTKKRINLSNGIWPTTKNLKEREIEHRLGMPITLNCKDERLEQVIDDLHDMSGVNVVPDKAALEDAGVSLDRPLTLKVENMSLKSALNLLLKQVRLTYVIKDEALQITTEENAKGKLKRVTYPVADLVVPVENFGAPKPSDFQNYLNGHFNNTPQTLPPVPYTGPNSMWNGNPVSNPTTGTMPVSNNQNVTANVHRPGQTIEEELIKLVTSTVAPESWSDVGGPGTIKYYPLGLALIINQTLDIQEQVQDLLEALRRLQDLEVAIEMRLISVSEDFFERIGVNFEVNIVNPNNKFDNNLLTTNFQPFGFINNFTPNGFAAGLTPAGTLTPDLGFPIRQNSFALTSPPFGYPYQTGSDGGLSLGLAFLSDIQVFMFMEAAQGDRRVNVMQAPKLTMFNGQTATLNVTDFQFFQTSVQPGFTGTGQLFFTPQNQPVPLGVSLTVQPVVSGDRRFVRMNLAPSLTNLATANVPLIPVQIPIPQVFSGGISAPGQDQLFQIFLQQPTFTQISIQTTVSVPDGGTVMLGGLKTLSEGRNEFGPPILSKIPYINRLFKNVGYGREAQSLLIMVTPRIIINLEEEVRQTGGPGGIPEGPGGPGGPGGP